MEAIYQRDSDQDGLTDAQELALEPILLAQILMVMDVQI